MSLSAHFGGDIYKDHSQIRIYCFRKLQGFFVVYGRPTYRTFLDSLEHCILL